MSRAGRCYRDLTSVHSSVLDWYQYTEELLTLQHCVAARPKPVPQALTRNTSPLDQQEWSRALAAHPDRRFVEYVSSGVRDSFRVGDDYSNTCAVAARNMQSARDHPEVVRVYLEDERAKGQVLGPLQPDEVPGVHTSRERTASDRDGMRSMGAGVEVQVGTRPL